MSYTRTVGETTVHVIGKCPVKDCRNRKRNTCAGVVKQDRWRTWTVWGIPAGEGYDTVPASNSYPERRPSAWMTDPAKAAKASVVLNLYERVWIAAIHAAGWICTDHDRFMTLTVVKGTVNEDKTCDARCRNATGPNCDCPCGGEQHGASWT